MDNVELKRERISNVSQYSSPSWKLRCQMMKPSQVIAVYHRFLNKGLFDELKSAAPLPSEEQITIFDLLKEASNG